jgi:hypothetical protein
VGEILILLALSGSLTLFSATRIFT